MVCRGGLKLKERLLVGVSAATVLFTLLLVVDLQMDAGMVGRRFVPNHARVKVGNLEDPTGAVYNGFRNRLLQKTHSYNSSKEAAQLTQTGHGVEDSQNQVLPEKHKGSTSPNPPEVHDDFSDLMDYLDIESGLRIDHVEVYGLVRPVVQKSDEGDLTRVGNPSLGQLKQLHAQYRMTKIILDHWMLVSITRITTAPSLPVLSESVELQKQTRHKCFTFRKFEWIPK